MREETVDPERNGSAGALGPAVHQSAPALPAASADPQDDPVNILLVDDRPEQLLVLETILAGLGQNLVRAGSGRPWRGSSRA